MRGASAAEEILQHSTQPNLRVFVVWEPILWGDWHHPTTGTLARISDARAAQFWDPGHIVAQELKRAMKPETSLPKPKCCTANGFYWDMAAIFPTGARSNGALPQPVFFDGAVVSQASAIKQKLKELSPSEGR